MDGVVFDFGRSFKEYMLWSGLRTEQQCTEVLKMDFYLDWEISHEEFKTYCHAGVDAGIVFFHGEPFPDARESMEALKRQGHRLHIITDRTFGTNNHSEVLTKEWLEKYEIPYDSLTFSADKTIVITDIMLDDKIENYLDLKEAGCYAVLYDRPWNQPKNGEVRVGSFKEFVNMVGYLAFEEDNAYDYNLYGEELHD